MKSVLRVSPLIAVLFLASCGKEPTETQKAQIEPLLISCSMAVNPTSLDDDNPFAALTRLGNLSEITNKEWSLSDNETLITAGFRSDTTAFECDFVKNEESEWDIEKVRRNGEEVYDRPTAEAKRAELKAEKEAQEEAERIDREKKKEEERLLKIASWQEKGYSNATYKYYAKYPVSWNDGMWSSPELRIVCDPDYPRFQLDDSQIRMSGRVDIEFQFKDSEGNITKTLIDLTSSGNAGEAYESGWGEDVRVTEESNAVAINKMKESISLEVGGMTFTMDDVSLVPCI